MKTWSPSMRLAAAGVLCLNGLLLLVTLIPRWWVRDVAYRHAELTFTWVIEHRCAGLASSASGDLGLVLLLPSLSGLPEITKKTSTPTNPPGMRQWAW